MKCNRLLYFFSQDKISSKRTLVMSGLQEFQFGVENLTSSFDTELQHVEIFAEKWLLCHLILSPNHLSLLTAGRCRHLRPDHSCLNLNSSCLYLSGLRSCRSDSDCRYCYRRSVLDCYRQRGGLRDLRGGRPVRHCVVDRWAHQITR